MQWIDRLQRWTWTFQVVLVFYQLPFGAVLKIINKCGPKAKAKILCPSIYQEWTSVWSSAVPDITQRPAKNSQQADGGPWFKRKINTVANNNHNNNSNNRSLKEEIQYNLLNFLTLSSVKSPELFLQAHHSGKIMSSVFQQSSSSTVKLT